MRKGLFWLLDNVYLGRASPYVLGLALGKMPKRIKVDGHE